MLGQKQRLRALERQKRGKKVLFAQRSLEKEEKWQSDFFFSLTKNVAPPE